MSIVNIAAILISLAALFSFINYRYIKLPMTIGLMAQGLVLSLLVLLGDAFGLPLKVHADKLISSIDFNETLMQGMLSYLLFAGALHVNLEDLAKQKWVIAVLASVGVVSSSFIIGLFMWLILPLLGIELSFIYCLVFGSLISPTDPIAVLGILKAVGAPKALATKIAGESLFNDGVGVVVFLVVAGIAASGQVGSPDHIAALFVEEALGGAVLGLVLGSIVYWMLKQTDHYSVEILLTVALVSGGYALATAIHFSGPIAMVIAGLLIGNHGRASAMSDTTREHLDSFWELIDEILNAVLFVLIGLEVLVLQLSGQSILAGILAIPLVLLARFIVVATPVSLFKLNREFSPNAIKVMTWGGLRGGISVALALSLAASSERDVILVMTYIVVAFSILVQGTTVGKLIKHQ